MMVWAPDGVRAKDVASVQIFSAECNILQFKNIVRNWNPINTTSIVTT